MRQANHWLSVLGLIALSAFAQSVLANTCTAKTGGPYNWSQASSWTGCNNKSPQDGDTVIIPNGSTVTLNADTSQLASLTVQAGGVLQGDGRGRNNLVDLTWGPGSNLTNYGTITLTDNILQIAGNFVNNGSFNGGNPASGSVTQFSGTPAIGGTSPTTFANLDLSGTTAVLLGNNVTVAGALTGPVTLTSTCPTDYTLTSNNGATVQHSCPAPFSCAPPPNIPSNVTVTCQCDTFNRASLNPSTIFNSNWTVSTSDATGILPSIVNPGYLRLTNKTGNNAKAATVPGIFPAAGNYISVEFRQYAYDGTGADGIAVTLSDYSVPAVPGAYGGSLGYAQETGIHDGFAGGWLGVALDEYGNYQNTNEGRLGGPGFTPESVGARGSGSGQTGYRWLGGTGGLSPKIDNNNSTSPSLGYYYQVVVDATNDPASTSIAVNRDTGSGYTPLISIPNVYAAAIAQGFTQAPVPTNWQISFTGSTGGSTNIHEIGGLRICASTMAPPSGGTAGGFNAIDEAYGTPPSVAVQSYLTGHIYTKLVGTPFKLDVAALSNSQIVTTYAISIAKKVTVNLVDNSDSLADPTKDCTLSCTSTCTAKPAVTGGTQSLNFAYGATDKGQKQSLNFTLNTAYQKLVAIISDGTTAACSTDSFSVRPLSIASVTSSNANNTNIFKAGSDNFDLTATTTGVSGSPSGYTGVMKMNMQPVGSATATGILVCSSTPPVCPVGTAANTFPATTPAPVTDMFTYSEVGSLQFFGYTPDATCTVSGTALTAAQCNLTPRGVYDDSWTGVDSNNTKNDCLLNSYSNIKATTPSTDVGKYGCNFGLLPNTVTFGRFVPDHFDTTVDLTAGVPMPCPTGLTCPALYNGFVYAGQPFTANIYARNASGNTTQNYDGTMGLSKQVTLNVWNALGGTTAITSGTLNNNTVAASAFRNGSTVLGTPASPNFTFTITPTAPTDIYVRAVDTDSITSWRAAASIEGGVKVVSGRVNIPNAYGSELLPLTLTATVQYWGGLNTGYVTSATDNLNIVTVAKINRTNCQGKLLSGGACSASLGTITSVTTPMTVPPSYGVYSIKLGAPGAGNAPGSEDLLVNVGWPIWLPSTTGRATFGVYKGAKEFIYQREAY
jgi:MSHA biogenesis protein MshQ